MDIIEIKAALISGARVRVVGVDYVDNYHVAASQDGMSLRFFLNYEAYEVESTFANIDRALNRRGSRVFRKEFTNGVMITIVTAIGDEV